MIRFLQTSGKTTKYVLGGLLVIICAAMVITLVPGGMLGDAFGFGSPQQGVLASVAGRDVTVLDVDRAARNQARQYGGNIPDVYMGMLRQRAADQLIVQKALLAEAEHMGLKVTDAELQETLQHGQFGEILFPNGQYIGDDKYELWVSNTFNMTVPQFQEELRNSLLQQKLQAAIEGPVSISKQEVAAEYTKQNTQVKFQYAVLSLDDVTKSIKPTDAELQAFFDSNKQQYVNSIPEKRQVQYAVVDLAKLDNQVQISNTDLQNYYHEHQDEYRVPEQVNVRHILIKTPLAGPDGKVDQKAVDAARAKAEGILKQLKGGANFADLAKKNSEDTASAENGGSLGWIQRGRTVPEFEKAAFSLPPGETSDLVQTVYGFHIIHVDAKQQAHLKTIDEVKPDIEPVIRRQKAANIADNVANSIASQARTQGLEKAAQAKGLEVITSNPITRTDTLPGVGAAPSLMDAIFSAQPKAAPESVSTPNGFVIFQVNSVTPPQTPTFEQIRARVESDFKAQKAQSLLGQKTTELAAKARSGKDLKKAAKEAGATLKTSDLVKPDGQVPDLGQMSGPASVAFNMKPGDISGPIVTARNGAVLQVLDRKEPAPDEVAKGMEQMREAMLERKRNDQFTIFALSLKDRLQKQGKIRINKDEWTRIMNVKPEAGE